MPPAVLLKRRTLLLSGLALMAGTPAIKPTAAQATTPEAGTQDFQAIEALFQTAVQTGLTPGAVAAVGHQGKVVWTGVFGQRAIAPAPEAMTWDTRFDMASLTKALVTAPALMQLRAQGLVTLDTPVWHYLPAFAANGKQDITIRHLLTHYSGLPPDLPLDTPWQGRDTAIALTMACRPVTLPGTHFLYSDINFITLGLVIEKLSGQRLADYASTHILAPLAMRHSCFTPSPHDTGLIAPTQFDETGMMLRGVVHDPSARRMGGVAGHAGLFSCADDLILYAQALLDKRAGLPSPFPLSTQDVVLMSTPQQPAGMHDLRGLGWDIATHYSTPRGDYFPSNSFGHTGFTGTSLWLAPNTRSFVLILTNRVHPNGKGRVVQLRHDVASAAALALQSMP